MLVMRGLWVQFHFCSPATAQLMRMMRGFCVQVPLQLDADVARSLGPVSLLRHIIGPADADDAWPLCPVSLLRHIIGEAAADDALSLGLVSPLKCSVSPADADDATPGGPVSLFKPTTCPRCQWVQFLF